MSSQTVNAWLSMKNSLQSRLSELKDMKNNATTRRISEWDGKKETVEPTYDIKFIDKKCAQITTALFKIDRAIKEANAKTKVELDVDYDALVTPIE
jgi:hypothetical protein